jgi:hypothetical protein
MLGIGLAGTASADPWDRDRDAGNRVSRMQELRERIEARSMMGRPSLERTITGREIGRETVQRGDVYRDFRDRNEMMSQLNQATKIRASYTAAARGDEDSGSDRAFPNAGRATSNPVEFAAKSRPAREREYQTRQEMVSQLNTQTTMRASRTAAATDPLRGSRITRGPSAGLPSGPAPGRRSDSASFPPSYSGGHSPCARVRIFRIYCASRRPPLLSPSSPPVSSPRLSSGFPS